MHRTLDLCADLGVRIINVPEPLPRPIMFCGATRTAFVDGTISPTDLRQDADWLLTQALRARS